MRERFGLRFERSRSAGELQESPAMRAGARAPTPSTTSRYCLTSVDFAKQEKVLQELERTGGTW